MYACLIQISICWELVGVCSYLLIGFWFTRSIAASACKKAFVTNRVGDFGFLLGILGFYWMTGSFEFRDLFETWNPFIQNNGVNSLFATLCAFLLFTLPVQLLNPHSSPFMYGYLMGGTYSYFGSYTCCYYGSGGNFSCS